MTTVLKFSPFALSGVSLGVNEIASSIAIGKVVGTIFTRKTDAQVFDALERVIGISKLPPWLHYVDFGRRTMLHGSDFRSIVANLIMDDVEMDRLQGLATLFVLCLRFVEPKQSIDGLLNEFLAGQLGTVIGTSEYVEDGVFSKSVRPLLGSFVEACVASDADSRQANDARNWMVQLTNILQDAWPGSTIPTRRLQASRAFLKAFFRTGDKLDEAADGGPALEAADLVGARAASIHDTKHITTAHLALTAAANGADVLLQCIDNTGVTFLPEGKICSRNTLLVRLWLSQPPLSILSVFAKHSIADSDTTDRNSGGLVIYGGVHEVAFWCARKLQVNGEFSTKSGKETAQALWQAGVELGKRCTWCLRITDEELFGVDCLHLGLDVSKLEVDVDSAAVSLVRHLNNQTDSLDFIARAVASAVHRFYRLSDYHHLMETVKGHRVMLGSMRLVIVALVTSLLHQVVKFPDGSQFHYALSLDDATSESGSFSAILINAGMMGVAVPHCIAAACTLWGGMTGVAEVRAEHALGLVAPQCSIILDGLRDPILAAKQGISQPWLLGCRGSMPMLPRDRATGWVQSMPAKPTGTFPKICDHDMHFAPQQEVLGEITFTFQDVTGDPSKGLLCCWRGGHLIHEIDPSLCFYHLLCRPIGQVRMDKKEYRLEEVLKDEPPRWIAPTELLKMGHFVTNSGAGFAVFFDAGRNAALALIAAGLCQRSQMVMHRGPPETLRLETRKFLTSSDFVICFEA